MDDLARPVEGFQKGIHRHGHIAPVIGIADKIPGLPVIIPGIHIGAGSISGVAEALLLGSQILIELLAGYDAEGVSKAQFPEGVVVGLGQVQLHRVLIHNAPQHDVSALHGGKPRRQGTGGHRSRCTGPG